MLFVVKMLMIKVGSVIITALMFFGAVKWTEPTYDALKAWGQATIKARLEGFGVDSFVAKMFGEGLGMTFVFEIFQLSIWLALTIVFVGLIRR